MEIKSNNYLKQLKGDIEFSIQSYFYDKTENIDVPEKAEEAIQERINLLIADVYDLLETADTDVSNVIEEFSEENFKAELDDMRTQEYLERDLFEEAI